LENIRGLTVKEISDPQIKECYEIWVDQPIDHLNRFSPTFKQQIIVGINDSKAPVVMFTEGYALGKITKPEFVKNGNVIYVEHRFYGKSKPDSIDWKFLTIKQAAYDLHVIHELFSKVLKGRWLTTGASKSGQTAIAYKMYFPKDADATIAYVTPVKSSADDIRITDYLNSLLKSDCGKRVSAFQRFILLNKAVMYNEFEKYTRDKKYTFNKIGPQKAFEYIILEFPFSFFQNCNDCRLIPDTLSDPAKIIEELVSVVPTKFYSDGFLPKLEPSFYMFYHELGYYEYDTKSLKLLLSDSTYCNSIFSPEPQLKFDNSYLMELNKFISDPNAERLIFIYGEKDPYTGAQPSLTNKNCLKMTVKNGCHKSRIEELSQDQKKTVYKQLSDWLQWPVGN
jgi:hypothetical protein